MPPHKENRGIRENGSFGQVLRLQGARRQGRGFREKHEKPLAKRGEHVYSHASFWETAFV